MSPVVRRLHLKWSPFLFVLVAVSAASGVGYRAGKKWFGMDGPTGQTVMQWHTGGWLGVEYEPYYVVLAGSALLFLLITGVPMLLQKAGGSPSRHWHRIFGAILFLPLAATAVTGILYKAGQAWFGISEETADLLMTIHEGGWLGKNLKVYYSVAVGGGFLALGILGLATLRKRAMRRVI